MAPSRWEVTSKRKTAVRSLLTGVVAVVALGSAAPSRVVQLVTFVAEGTVDSVHPALSPTIQVGDPFRLGYTFDATTADTSPATGIGAYDAITSLGVQVGTYTASSSSGGISVQDSFADAYGVWQTELTGAAVGGQTLDALQGPLLQLNDPTGTAIRSDALPGIAPNPADFVSGGTFMVLAFSDASVIAHASVDTITTGPPVPVPLLPAWGFGVFVILIAVVGAFVLGKRRIEGPARS